MSTPTLFLKHRSVEQIEDLDEYFNLALNDFDPASILLLKEGKLNVAIFSNYRDGGDYCVGFIPEIYAPDISLANVFTKVGYNVASRTKPHYGSLVIDNRDYIESKILNTIRFAMHKLFKTSMLTIAFKKYNLLPVEVSTVPQMIYHTAYEHFSVLDQNITQQDAHITIEERKEEI